jgi:protein-S-isoprenylcysteine O-methyltransferase Ste14
MESDNKNLHKITTHTVLAHSYSVYFVLFLIGIVLDLVLRVKIFTDSVAVPLGVAIIILGSILVFWAQKTSRDLKLDNLSKDTFYQGPYRYTRGPTHFGLFLLLLGFGIIVNSFFVVLFTIIAFLISKFVFLNKQEKMLAEKYGIHYVEYQKLVKF